MHLRIDWASRVVWAVKILPDNAGDIGDTSSIPGSGRAPGGGHGNPLQYSCLENSMDRGVWWATGHGVAKTQMWLKWLSMHTQKLARHTWEWKEMPKAVVLNPVDCSKWPREKGRYEWPEALGKKESERELSGYLGPPKYMESYLEVSFLRHIYLPPPPPFHHTMEETD